MAPYCRGLCGVLSGVLPTQPSRVARRKFPPADFAYRCLPAQSVHRTEMLGLCVGGPTDPALLQRLRSKACVLSAPRGRNRARPSRRIRLTPQVNWPVEAPCVLKERLERLSGGRDDAMPLGGPMRPGLLYPGGTLRGIRRRVYALTDERGCDVMAARSVPIMATERLP